MTDTGDRTDGTLYKDKCKKLGAHFGSHFSGIDHNVYMPDKLAEKLVDHYLTDVGRGFKDVLVSQKQAKEDQIALQTLSLDSDESSSSDESEATSSSIPIEPEIRCYPGRPEWKICENMIRNINLRKVILFCVDLEAYERNTKIVTEIGVTIYDPRENLAHSVLPLIRSYHYCIEEAWDLRNGRFVDDAKENFIFGDSILMPLDDVVNEVQFLVDKYLIPHNKEEHTWKRALVGHGVEGDIYWLESLNINLPKNVQRFDTLEFCDSMYSNHPSLKRLLNLCHIPTAYLHNAGNDSYYTLQLLLSMCDIGTRIKLRLDDWRYVRAKLDELYEQEQAEKQLKRASRNKQSEKNRANRIRSSARN
ncbi:ribonuclease H-like domain [Kluyveromyces marxianus]|uniref:Ribonuclease H-like domain n=1 Tax=Kluyveromyces marxianus TaxID=4911 RepID=A0ABX6EPF6_KLUMA|nr:ribonuclease H-like domain [Kluyveromyces marxianus]